MTRLAIVDVGCGNTGSVAMAFRRLGAVPVITGDADEIVAASHVVLPGVGAAGFAMERIEALGLASLLSHLTQPVLGICLGMRSEEHTSELQSLMRISYAVFCLKKKKTQ